MWWQILIGAAVLVVVGYCFISVVRSRTRSLTRKTSRTAADMYDAYADPPSKQRKFAEERGGEWKNE